MSSAADKLAFLECCPSVPPNTPLVQTEQSSALAKQAYVNGFLGEKDYTQVNVSCEYNYSSSTSTSTRTKAALYIHEATSNLQVLVGGVTTPVDAWNGTIEKSYDETYDYEYKTYWGSPSEGNVRTHDKNLEIYTGQSLIDVTAPSQSSSVYSVNLTCTKSGSWFDRYYVNGELVDDESGAWSGNVNRSYNFDQLSVIDDTLRRHSSTPTNATEFSSVTLSGELDGAAIYAAAKSLASSNWSNRYTANFTELTFSGQLTLLFTGNDALYQVTFEKSRFRFGYARPLTNEWFTLKYQLYKEYDGTITPIQISTVSWSGTGDESEADESNWTPWIEVPDLPWFGPAPTDEEKTELAGTSYRVRLLEFKNYHSGPWVKVNDPAS